MKRQLYIIVVIGLTIMACSKKSNTAPNTVNIEGSAYPTVVLGNQTWTSINYDGPGGLDLANNNPAYGKFYTLAESKAVVLPSGWRLPTYVDFLNLANLTGGHYDPVNGMSITQDEMLKLMSTAGWQTANGTNSTGFNAQPAGFYIQSEYNGLVWELPQWMALFLTSDSSQTYCIIGFEPGSIVYGSYNLDLSTTGRGSIRFVKDN